MAMILVTDDDCACRDTMQRTLERAGHRVESAADVDDALEAIRNTPFDLIVCDCRMPGKSGLDLLVELNRIGSHIPFLMVTAYTDVKTETAIKQLGGGFLRKPLRREEFVQSVARAML
jgi:DNA-binding NtrC family response regulator